MLASASALAEKAGFILEGTLNPSLERIETAAPPRRVPRVLSCLVKGPLGCLFFVLGGVVVFVLLLPPALGRVLDHTLERSFAERHAGHLELGDAWLGSFYNEQRIERVILRDPDGDEILRGQFSAPALAELFDSLFDGDASSRSEPVPLPDPFGPVDLRIDLLHLVESEDGTTNLERALEELPRESDESDGESGASTDLHFRFSLQVFVARLRTTSARGKSSELTNLDFHGTLEWGPEETRLVLEGGSDPELDEPLHLRVELSRPEFGRHRPWKSALVLEGVPSALTRTLCPPARTLVSLAGPRTGRLSWSEDGAEVALSFEDEGARFELLGEEHDGLVTGPKGSVLAVTLPCSSAPGQTLLAALLPLVLTLECVDPSQIHELRLADYRWPLDGDWSGLSGELELELAPMSCAFVPRVQASLGERAIFEARTLRMQVREGVLAFAELAYPLGPGELRVDGTLELASGAAELSVTGALGGQPIELRLAGEQDDLVPALPEPPDPPEDDVAGVPSPPDQDR